MVIDAAKGIETQTRKLFEVCRLRDVPIITFVNKLDREGRDPFDLMSEIEQDLQLHVTPASWPIGMGQSFLGCYDLFNDRLLLLDARRATTWPARARSATGLNDPKLDALLPAWAVAQLREEVEMARGLCPPFDLESYREGHLTPVFFGSALNNFGVRELLHGLAEVAPPPRPQPAVTRDGGAGRGEGLGLRLQDPGEHGPQAPGPHRLRPPLLRPFRAGHETASRPLGQDHGASTTPCSSWPATASWPRRPSPGTSSASPTTATCASATP